MAAHSSVQSQTATELIGRDWELSLLVERARRASPGAGQAVLVRGPAGIGKTRLLSAVLNELEPLAKTVLSVTCPEGRSTGYETVRGLFEPLWRTGDGPASSPLLSGSARLALPALLPHTEETGPADAYAVMYGLHWLTAGLSADGLVVLAIDDIQWCDETSLRWLGFLLRRAEDLPLLVVMTQRTGADQPELLDEISDALGCLTLDLPPLTADAVGDVLHSAFGVETAPAFVATCTDITGGSPFLLQRVVTRLRAEAIPPGVEQVALLDELGRCVVTRSQLDRLPEDAYAVAKAIAVLGGESIEMTAALAGTRPGPAGIAVEALRAQDLLLGDGVDYAHDLIRQAVLDATPAEELVALRRRAARLLNDAGRPAEEIAVQLMRLPGDPTPWMVGVLRAAAASAEHRGAPGVAARYLSHALKHDPDDVGLLAASGKVLAQSDPAKGLEHLERALGLVSDPRIRSQLVVQYALTSLGAQNSLRAFALVGETLDTIDAELGENPDPADRALRTLVESVYLLSGLDEKSTVEAVSRRFADYVPPPGDTPEERQLLAMLSSLGTLKARPAPEVAAQARKVLDIGEIAPGGWAVLGSSLSLFLADEIDLPLRALTDLIEHAQGRGEAWTYVLSTSVRAEVHLWAGNVGEALSDAQSAFDVMVQEAWAPTVVMPQTALAGALIRRGEPKRAQDLLDLVTRPRLDRFAIEYHHFTMARARTRAALGDLEGALTHLLHCGDSLAEAGIDNPVLAPWWLDAAEALAGLGRAHEGLDLLERVEEPVRRWGTCRALGMIRMARGVLTAGDSGIDLLIDAVNMLADSPGRLQQSRAEYLLGRRLHRRGDAEGARERLRRSIDLAVLCRDKQQLDQSLPALTEAGGRLWHGTDSPADALSGSERRVAEQAAAGATNREIAESLFLTQRTVEFHLTSVYRKLGIRSRLELPAALMRV
ncbi:ATP-binding protein [Streptomyces coffeae]|uniref:AAA family ATPase n=1 Tax=Streptomyces coffeae TaxID=621382 RepID=A0ABS1NJG0_9ACTN|nr:LuxR family transcriptional regulator [Streptomyces coffeae]MBL1100232.1 AAA family ATPase [Streptomyces coffeae]